jgi:hypothetical protein
VAKEFGLGFRYFRSRLHDESESGMKIVKPLCDDTSVLSGDCQFFCGKLAKILLLTIVKARAKGIQWNMWVSMQWETKAKTEGSYNGGKFQTLLQDPFLLSFSNRRSVFFFHCYCFFLFYSVYQNLYTTWRIWFVIIKYDPRDHNLSESYPYLESLSCHVVTWTEGRFKGFGIVCEEYTKRYMSGRRNCQVLSYGTLYLFWCDSNMLEILDVCCRILTYVVVGGDYARRARWWGHRYTLTYAESLLTYAFVCWRILSLTVTTLEGILDEDSKVYSDTLYCCCGSPSRL